MITHLTRIPIPAYLHIPITPWKWVQCCIGSANSNLYLYPCIPVTHYHRFTPTCVMPYIPLSLHHGSVGWHCCSSCFEVLVPTLQAFVCSGGSWCCVGCCCYCCHWNWANVCKQCVNNQQRCDLCTQGQMAHAQLRVYKSCPFYDLRLGLPQYFYCRQLHRLLVYKLTSNRVKLH